MELPATVSRAVLGRNDHGGLEPPAQAARSGRPLRAPGQAAWSGRLVRPRAWFRLRAASSAGARRRVPAPDSPLIVLELPDVGDDRHPAPVRAQDRGVHGHPLDHRSMVAALVERQLLHLTGVHDVVGQNLQTPRPGHDHELGLDEDQGLGGCQHRLGQSRVALDDTGRGSRSGHAGRRASFPDHRASAGERPATPELLRPVMR